MNIAHTQAHSKIYGPGTRYVIWLQGCSIRCPGCWNKEMWAFQPKLERPIDQVLIDIQAHSDSIEGITLLGGEPLDQYAETLGLCKKVQALGLSTMLFTGYEMEELEQAEKLEILPHLDILITGRYQEAQRNTNLQWIGSENQEIHFLTDRYEDYSIKNANYVEIHLGVDGGVEVLGFPEGTLRNF